MRTIFTTAAALAATIAGTAHAQERAPFTGAHVEGLLGYDNVEGSDGLLYGAGGGFDFQAGKAILGVEGEFIDSDAKSKPGCSGHRR